MIDIQILRKYNQPHNLAITQHARIRLRERNITVADIVSVIDNGEIVMQYEDDKPLPSCLVLGMAVNQNYMHVVVSYEPKTIHIITAYYPDPEKWESDYKARK